MPTPVNITNDMLQDADVFVVTHRNKWFARLGKAACQVVGACWYSDGMYAQLREMGGKPFVVPVAEFEQEYKFQKAIR